MKASSVELIVRALQDAGVRYLVVGGLAVIAHGYVRLTVDVDLLIQLEPANIMAALGALGKLGYAPAIPVTHEQFADPSIRQQWIVEKNMQVLKLFSNAHPETSIDVFVSDPLGFEAAFARALTQPLTDTLVAPVCGYQDLVKLKLLAGRPKDLDDLAKLRQARGEA